MVPDGLLLPPQALKPVSTTISARIPNIDSHLRRRAGIPGKATNARKAPPPAPAQPLPLPPILGQINSLLVVVELTVTVAVPVIVPLSRVTVELPAEQVGRLVAPVGDEVRAQVRVTVPV